MSNIINFCDYIAKPSLESSDCEDIDSFAAIEPLIRDVCFSAGVIGDLANELIAEYKLYFEQLSTLESHPNSGEQFNHACHIILELLIKSKLRR
ncbi:hypothetical protein GCM10007916_09110 [Psychromonas marina]|uniref:Uncharacterized protein n=1 Tax=Psychromonas marina TaxID=88364 RepID=A0ABQ6DXX6_9GAMM|nr:hypothetical protein [Psychromonas marina]GLS89844.1 hypothetical protein GCM10007916_09110 [Psychromonas marina]